MCREVSSLRWAMVICLGQYVWWCPNGSPPGRRIVKGFVASGLGHDLPVVRMMSNTPVLVDEAMSVISAGRLAGEERLRRTEDLPRPAGKVRRSPERRSSARRPHRREVVLPMSTTTWSRRWWRLRPSVARPPCRESGENPVLLREAVTSAAGTTASAVRELDKHRVRAALLAAIEAARDRGRELGAQE